MTDNSSDSFQVALHVDLVSVVNYMQNLSQTLSSWEHLWRKQNVIYWAFGWAALSLITYIFFGGAPARISHKSIEEAILEVKN